MRIVCVLLLIFSLCACAANIRPSEIKCEPITDFTCTVDCTQNEQAFSFTLTSSADGHFSLLVTQPERLAGVSFLYADGSYTVDANGIKAPFSADAFEADSPVTMLFEGLLAFLFTGAETLTSMDDGSYATQRFVEQSVAAAVFSEDGKIIKLQYPNENTAYSFTYSEN